MKRALITGITGQDGSYLAESLLKKGYQVFGLVRFSRVNGFENIKGILDRITLYNADLLEYASLAKLLEEVQADEIYNLASISFVPQSWRTPLLVGEINALGAIRLLEAVRAVHPKTQFYQASSSEMFGQSKFSPQNENTPLCPVSPYAAAKVYAHHMAQTYRMAYGIPVCCGILFNHESPRRGLEFVTRKVARGVAMIKLGLAKELFLGNIDAQRDWGYSPDYVEAMWRMLQQPEPDIYVIATGKTRSVKELLETAFAYLQRPWQDYVRMDPKLQRPTDLNSLVGDAGKARNKLNWAPKKPFKEMIWEMIEADLALLKR